MPIIDFDENIRFDHDPAYRSSYATGTARVLVRDMEGGIQCVYSGFITPARAYRKIESLIDLRRDFGDAKARVALCCHRGFSFGSFETPATVDDLNRAFAELGLPSVRPA